MRAARTPPVPHGVVDHTGDLGVVVRGSTLPDLFAASGAVLAELIYETAGVAEREEREVALEAATAEDLLVRWLNDLIYLWEVGEFLWRTVEVEMEGENRLVGRLRGEPLEAGRHVCRRGLKAATYHQLRISRDGEEWSARIIFDI